VVLAVGALLAGCVAAPGDAIAPIGNGPLPEGVTAEFVQLRSDVGPRQAQVRVRNATDTAVEVADVFVSDQRFDGDAVRVIAGRTSTVPAGSTTDIRVQLPPMRCEATDGSMWVLLDLDGVTVEGPLADPLGVIGPLHARECLAERVADAATLEFVGFEPSPPGEPAVLQLRIEPQGGANGRIDSIQTTNLLTFASQPAATIETYPIGVDTRDQTGPATIDLPLVPLRCDAHAVQEDKRGTIFTVAVEVDAEAGLIELAAPADLRGRILTWVAEWCGFGS
jgi:hypothetical protein